MLIIELFVGAGRKTVGVLGWSGIFAFTVIGGMTIYGQYTATRGPTHSDEQRRSLGIVDRKSQLIQQIDRHGQLEQYGITLAQAEDAFRMQRLAIEQSKKIDKKN
jgi:hypothetical protein